MRKNAPPLRGSIELECGRCPVPGWYSTKTNVAHMPMYHVVIGMEALWGAANVSCPMNAGTGQCSYTPQPISLELNLWKEFTFSAEAKFGESHNYHLGRSGPAPSSVYTQYGAETAVNCVSIFAFRLSPRHHRISWRCRDGIY